MEPFVLTGPFSGADTRLRRILYMIRITDLFDLEHTIAADYLKGFEYPWEALSGIKQLIIDLRQNLTTTTSQPLFFDPNGTFYVAQEIPFVSFGAADMSGS